MWGLGEPRRVGCSGSGNGEREIGANVLGALINYKGGLWWVGEDGG